MPFLVVFPAADAHLPHKRIIVQQEDAWNLSGDIPQSAVNSLDGVSLALAIVHVADPVGRPAWLFQGVNHQSGAAVSAKELGQRAELGQRTFDDRCGPTTRQVGKVTP